MEIKDFIYEYNRMCNQYSYCQGCPLFNIGCLTNLPSNNYDFLMKIVKIVEQWSKDHPKKTIMQDFFEKFPNAPKDEEDGTPEFCPDCLGYKIIENCDCQNACVKCWNRPVED